MPGRDTTLAGHKTRQTYAHGIPSPLAATEVLLPITICQGPATVFTGIAHVPLPSNYTLGGVIIYANTAPTGLSLIVDVLYDNTSVYSTHTANRPTIAASAHLSQDPMGAPDTTALAHGHVLSFSILQIGSTIAGSDVTGIVQLFRTSP